MSTVTTVPTSEFDVGPLTWVRGEIDQALARAQADLESLRAAPADGAVLERSRANAHQATGAMVMAGLDSVVPFGEEIERSLAALADADAATLAARCAAIDRACRRLKVFLREVEEGAPLVALTLLPEYDAMQRLRGVEAPAASDLFYPDLSLGAAPLRMVAGAAGDAALTHLVAHRRAFQGGLLVWLRGDPAGAIAMRDAVAGIEALTVPPATRSFWWTVGALFEALAGGGIEAGLATKQLAARIDMQIRRFVEGSKQVAERLRREVLYQVAISVPVSPAVRDVQRAFRLADLVPSSEAASADSVRQDEAVRAAREAVGAAKEAWLAFTSGRAEGRANLQRALAAVRDGADEAGSAALSRLAGSLAERVASLPGSKVAEALALEYATALLLIESAFDRRAGETPELAQEVDAMLARLDAAQAQRPPEAGVAPPRLDEISKRAQERALLAQVTREIQVNLRHIEQVLDAFFRDPGQRAGLSGLSKDIRQVGGALRMLGLDQAEGLLALCEAQIEAHAAAAAPVGGEDLELLAESLSCLGFYIEAVEQRRPHPERLIVPLLDRRQREATAPGREAVLEAAPEPALIGTAESIEEIEGVAAEAAPLPAISAETQRLLATTDNALDAEFLDIYLTEAAEVLDTVAGHRRLLAEDPGARDALRTVRRGFHTLKGSGRMVGLTELGEHAFAVERILNRLLEDEYPATRAVLAVIDAAEQSFRAWVGELRQFGRVRPDAHAVHAAIRALEAELPRDRESVLARPAPAAPPVVSAPPPPVDPEASGSVLEVIEITAGETDETRALAAAFGVTELAPVGETGALASETAGVDGGDEYGDEADSEILDFAPVAAPAPTPDVVTVGGVTLSAALHRILCGEADEILAALDAEHALMQFDPQHRPSAAMVRASHTLCGAFRTAGFPLIAETAKALERGLVATAPLPGPLPDSVLPIVADALAGLRGFVGRVRNGEGFDRSDEDAAAAIRTALAALAPAVAGAEPPEDAEALAVREAARHDEGEPPPAAAVPERDDVDAEILPVFLEEAAELHAQAGEGLRMLRAQPANADVAVRLRRTLHTLKGSARMAGALRLGSLAHRMESLLHEGDAQPAPAPARFDALESDLDHVAALLDALSRGEGDVVLPGLAPAAESAGPSVPETAIAGAALPGPLPAAPSAPAAPAPDVQPAPVAAPAAPAVPVVVAEVEAGQRAVLRVRADVIDQLVSEAGEVAVTRAQIDGELRALKANLLELKASVIRLRGQVREIEMQGDAAIPSRRAHAGETAPGFDPLEFDRYTRFQEVARSLAEGIDDVSTAEQALRRSLDAADTALAAQARLSRDMERQLFALRTVPFASLSERLYRVLRQAAKESGKRAELEIRGGEVELDRAVLERLAGPLEHLLRNAVDHGIEPAEARRAAGKPEAGGIVLTVRQAGNEIVLELADDGGGVDLEAIRARAVARGLVAAGAAPTEAQLVDCMFLPGISTATRVTELSGRGIGMDVVRSEVAALGGRVGVTTARGRGTTFLLNLPLTLAVAQAVLVRAAGRLWALPASMVEHVRQVEGKSLFDLYVARSVEWQGASYPFHYLPWLLGDVGHRPGGARHNAVLLLHAGAHRAAVHVEEMVGNQEVVVKNIGPQLARVPGIVGATVLGTGEIVLIVNPVQLAQRAGIPVFDPTAPDRVVPGGAASSGATGTRAPRVLIVDDSLTVRRVASRLLTREGFEVAAARDGIEALALLETQDPDVILLDIEMPRMDGFEFMRTIRRDPRFVHTPVVMITSRAAEKHRALARELGVDLYLGKPFQEQELLSSLRQMLELSP